MMKRCGAVFLVAGALAGCAAFSAEQRAAYRSGQEWKLSRASALTLEGNRSAALQVLTHIIAEPPVPGVTDEALFSRGLLRLETDDATALSLVRKDLELLVRKFPRSPRAPDAARLAGLLAAGQARAKQLQKLQGLSHALAQENARLKELNSQLGRDNRELQQTLEKLKTLDLEMGKGRK
jgi:hypothetical protein